MLTYDTVVAAINQIHERGQRPSLSLILRETGGSKTDVSRLFKRWREEKATTASAPPPAEIVALAALSPDLAIRIRQAYEDQSRAVLSKAQEDLALARQHVDELERSLGDTEAIQAQLRAELTDRAQMEQRLVDAMAQGVAAITSQQSPLLEAIVDLQRTVRGVVDHQIQVQGAIEAVHTRCSDLAGEIQHTRKAIVSLQADVATLDNSLHGALSQQMITLRNQIAAANAAFLQRLHFQNRATLWVLRTPRDHRRR
jgi:chromosome segregation ATPase